MRREPLREASAHADAAGGAHDDEAMLERYIEQPSPVHDWVEDKIRRAPWWCISLLVHLLALLVLWNWPANTSASVQETIWSPPVNIIATPPIDTPPPIDVRPPDPPPPPEKFEMRDVLESKVEGAPQDPTLPLLPPEERPEGLQTEEFNDMLQKLPPLIGIETDDGRPALPKSPYGPGRSELRRQIQGGPKGKGKGKWGDGPDDGTEVSHLAGALFWLARAQEKDGSWNAQSWEGSSPYRVGMTGLALLAYEGAGFTHIKDRFRVTIGRALDWLRANQKRDGSFPFETFYEQGIATMAVSEAFGMTQDPKLRPMAQKAINYIVRLQPEHGGFRYGGPVTLAEGDTSVTGWQIMAIKSALLAGLDVPQQAVDRSRAFLKNTSRDYGASSYLAGDKAAGSLAVTSIGLLCRTFLNDGGVYDAEIGQTAEFLRQRENPDFTSPEGGASKQLVTDIYYTYYSSLAMFQMAGGQSEHWRSWRKMYRAPLIATQVQTEQRDARGRPLQGSWDPAKHRWGDRGGRVYATALGALCLEAPFRYTPTSRAKP